jgi:hypothetical protein
MKRSVAILLTLQFIFLFSQHLFSQSSSDMQEFGIDAGALTNFPATQDYQKKNMSMLYVAPYVRTGKHEFSAGLIYPLTTHGLFFNDNNITPRLGAMAGYKFYIFNVFGRENLFVHYMFQYLRFRGNYDTYYSWSTEPFHWTETDMYINNVIGFGYNLFFDTRERFGFYYTLDYVISQTGYRLGAPANTGNTWATQYVWNKLSTNVGFSFKLTSLKKKVKQ